MGFYTSASNGHSGFKGHPLPPISMLNRESTLLLYGVIKGNQLNLSNPKDMRTDIVQYICTLSKVQLW
jgi:hypothetical protein